MDSQRQWYLPSGTHVSLGYRASPPREWEGVPTPGFAVGQFVRAGRTLEAGEAGWEG